MLYPQVTIEIEPFSPALDQIVRAPLIAEQIATGFGFTEGPVWMPGDFLVFSDIPGDTIYRWDARVGASIYRRPSANANGNTIDAAGRLITCEHSGRRVAREERDGNLTTLAAHYNGQRLNSPNDVVVHSSGAVYFTDPPFGLPNGRDGAELGFSGVYRIAPDGALALLSDALDGPNGLAFSPDERILYVNDSRRNELYAFDVLADGGVANARLIATTDRAAGAGNPDGMKLDSAGAIFMTGPGGVWIFASSGERLGLLRFPERTANLAWGAERGELYVTATTSVYRVTIR
ncbi:MAG: SMP-30/gluconolactonase/LRE family protein [Chloroflexales bacterium]|nr:SMP-30/gluconolactonase/LRE family protein [Chloroflexales bacterium]